MITEDIGVIRQQARDLHEATGELHQRSHYDEWTARTTQRGRSSTRELLDEFAELGFAWRDVARLVGVSVPAIQKWRRGEGTTGENRHKVASLLAACDLVADHYGIREVASWFEMPLLAGVPVTPIELWAGCRPDLVFDYASGHTDSEQVLTSWDTTWRQRYRSDYEVFRAGDGELSIRPKER
ncbi:MAG TPA: transcriptional regulator [Mycobacteriales bacterium]|nr:transcriptional regulator [Mycobacteriales bacterium]